MPGLFPVPQMTMTMQAKLVLEAALQEDQQDAQARLLLASVCLELKPPAHEEALECARYVLRCEVTRNTCQRWAGVGTCKGF